MKKILALILTLCMMTSMFSITALATDIPADENIGSEPETQVEVETSAETRTEPTTEDLLEALPAPAAGVVIRVIALKRDDRTPVIVKDDTSFEDGWNLAMDLAGSPDKMNENRYSYIIVNFYADWKATDGKFTDDYWSNGPGFDWDTIFIPVNAKVTLNLNGHTIDRGLKKYEIDGEVIYISKNAEVIINGGKNAEDPQTGKITGGFSGNGAGGIHNDGGDLTLNNVKLDGNTVEDDDGAAMALYNGASLIMNGGSISNNKLTDTGFFSSDGTLFISNSTVTLNNVTISGTICSGEHGPDGAVAYLEGSSSLTVTDCLIENNDANNAKPKTAAYSLFYAKDRNCVLTVSNTTFKNNGTAAQTSWRGDLSTIFDLNGELTVTNCTFTGNNIATIFACQKASSANVTVNDCTFVDNGAQITHFTGKVGEYANYHFTNCTFNNNNTGEYYASCTFEGAPQVSMLFTGCEFGDSIFKLKEYMEFEDAPAKDSLNENVGSLLGEGSLAMIASISALMIAVASLVVSIASKKKKTVPQTAEDYVSFNG